MRNILANIREWGKSFRPEYFILFTILTVGTAVIFITPPIQGTDEDIHFAEIWKLSHGEITATVPESLADFWRCHQYMIAHPEQKYSLYKWKQAWKLSYTENDKLFACPSLTFYSVLSHLPCIAAVSLTNLFTAKYLPAFYAARLASLGIFAFLVFWAIRIIPADKWLLGLIMLLPSTLFQSMLVSYDGITYGTSALWFALLYRDFLAENANRQISSALFWCSIGLCCCKLPYGLFVLALSLFLLYKEVKKRIYLISCVLICFSLTALQLAFKEINFPSTPIQCQLQEISRFCSLNHEILDSLQNQTAPVAERLKNLPFLIGSTLISPKRIMIYGGSYLGCLGWLDCLLPPVLLLLYAGVILLFCCSAETRLPWKKNIVLLANGIGITFTVLAIFAFTYVPVEGTIQGVTGRYFIPGSIFLFFAIRNRFLNIQKWKPLIFIAASLLIEITMIVTLLQRYYFDYWWVREI